MGVLGGDGTRGAGLLRGTVEALNFAPRGEIDGLMVAAEGGVVQVNIPPDLASGAAGLVGQTVEWRVGPEPKAAEHRESGGHRVCTLVDAGGGPADRPGPVDHGPKAHHHHHHAPGHGEAAEVAGRVERLNYANHGEPNGVVLDSGDFLHLKPGGMKAAGLAVGRRVEARGRATPMPSGGRAIQVEVIDGLGLGPRPPR